MNLNYSSLEAIFEEIKAERIKQDEKHPWDKLEINVSNYIKSYHAREADELKRNNDFQENGGYAYINTLCLEELHEVFAETDPIKQEDEMIQLVALGIKFIQWSRQKRSS